MLWHVAADNPRNQLLNALSRGAFARLSPRLAPVLLRVGNVLHHPEHGPDRIYFPDDSVICQLAVMSDGSTLETATLGVEGASWVPGSVGASSMPGQTMVAVSGSAHTLTIRDLERELEENEELHDVLTKYTHTLLIHSMRLTACTGVHTAHERCARWILTTVDQLQREQFAVTHELMATILGTTRPSITVIMQDLIRQGALTATRGRVAVHDRNRLLSASCECYDAIRAHYKQAAAALRSTRPRVISHRA